MEANLSYAASTNFERRKKLKAVGKSAQGNQHKFPQQAYGAKKQSSSDTSPSLLHHDYFVKDEIRSDIANLYDCCAKDRGLFWGCLLKHFGYQESSLEFETNNNQFL